VRARGAFLSTAALLWGFYQAPFLHIHPEDLDHPATGLVHAHVPEPFADSAATAAAYTADDDAVDVGWNIFPPSFLPFVFHAAISSPASMPPLVVRSVRVPVLHRRSHDPPELTPQQPRAPPA
jgi:hypothetical protein